MKLHRGVVEIHLAGEKKALNLILGHNYSILEAFIFA